MTATSESHRVVEELGKLGQVTALLEELSGSGTERLQERQRALLSAAEVGRRLAVLLDELAGEYERPGIPEQRSVQISLDQAAAAAEDLGNCARHAAEALLAES